MTQKDKILARFREGTWLSVIKATKEMYSLRLGARIHDLRTEGRNIIERKVAENPTVNICSLRRLRRACQRRSHRSQSKQINHYFQHNKETNNINVYVVR